MAALIKPAIMSQPSTATPTHEPHSSTEASRAKAPKLAMALGLLSTAALVIWTGVRVNQELGVRSATATPPGEELPVAHAPATVSAAATVRGEPTSFHPSLPCEGTLAPARQVDLAFKASGRLASLHVKVGQFVKQGEVLARLETAEAQAQLQAAEAQVRAAEAQLAIASDAEQRTTGMVDAGALPEATGVQVEKQKALALAQLDAARAQLSLARAALANHTLVAPFAGLVTRVPSGPGAMAAAGMPMFHLADVSTLKLTGTISEQDAPLLRVGSAIEMTAQGRTVKGEVVAVVPSVDPMTRRVPFEAEIPNTDEPRLLSGIFVRAKALAPEAVAVLKLPGSALRPGSQDEVVVVEDGKLYPRRVVLSQATPGELLVRAGLTADEEVLLAPPPIVTEGAELATLPGASR